MNPARTKSLSSILKLSLDRQPQPDIEPERPGAQHKNLRGSRYYNNALPPALF
jgi:hypothetical protein